MNPESLEQHKDAKNKLYDVPIKVDIKFATEVVWVNVNERQPKEPCRCLVWDIPYSIHTGKPASGYFDGESWETEISDDFSNVTHWVERLDPPSEG